MYQKIINLMPPHDTYVETHLGGGSIMRHKKPARQNIGIDIDPKVIRAWKAFYTTGNNDSSGKSSSLSTITKTEVRSRANTARAGTKKINGSGTAPANSLRRNDQSFTFIKADATWYLEQIELTSNDLIYADPPYLRGTRKSARDLYDFEMTEDQHIVLLSNLKKQPCMVLISGYWSGLYADILQGWNTLSFEAQTRRGKATEHLWFNYPVPSQLHDYSYLGDNYREREWFRNKKRRWTEKFKRLSTLEQNAILQDLTRVNIDACSHQQK